MEKEKIKIGYFEEDEGIKSSMRLMNFISLIAAIGLSGFGALTGQIDANYIALVTMFLVGAFAPKAVQRFAENK